MRKKLMAITMIVAFPLLLNACIIAVSTKKEVSGASEMGAEQQMVSVDAPSLRAKFSVVDNASGKIVVKGITPDTVLLNTNGDYRIEITHPKTGKVYTKEVKTRKNASGKSLLAPETVTAEF